jgi:ferric-dicitrate binding protein FerR (iron transport regulator)
MAKADKAKATLPYMQRLLEDEYVQEQVREAIAGLRIAYGRAARRPAQAPDDKKVYGNLRRAATSIRNATMALRKTEPPPKRRGRKLLIIVCAAGAAAMLTRLGRGQEQPATSPVVASPADTVPPAAAPGATAPEPAQTGL